MSRKATAFGAATLLLLASDCSTKRMALEWLPPSGRPVEVLGDALRFTLAFNTHGAAGLPLGRSALLGFAVAALGVIAWQYAHLAGRDARGAAALGLILGGALGNFADRLLSTRGVSTSSTSAWAAIVTGPSTSPTSASCSASRC